jgi:hypothetical protein
MKIIGQILKTLFACLVFLSALAVLGQQFMIVGLALITGIWMITLVNTVTIIVLFVLGDQIMIANSVIIQGMSMVLIGLIRIIIMIGGMSLPMTVKLC